MKRYITIDGGTTNTRVYLVEDGKITDSRRIGIGCNSPKSKELLTAELQKQISDMLAQNTLNEKDIHRVLCSGMITSELGLFTVPHSIAPAGKKEIAQGSKECMIPEITSIPFFFVSGVKTVGPSPLDTNMMRGEETELIGIMDEGEECIFALPGSHSKTVRVDKEGRITYFTSTLTGEMIAALTGYTILSVSVDIKADEPTESALLDGYNYAAKHGINEALLKPRALKVSGSVDNAYIHGFFLGAVLYDEIRPILKMTEKRIVIGGRKEIRRAMSYLIKQLSEKEVRELSDKEVSESTVHGVIKIFEYAENLK